MLCPNCIPWTDCHKSWNPGTGNVATHLHGWLSSWWLKPSSEKLFSANQRELTQPGKGSRKHALPPSAPSADPAQWPCEVTLHLTPHTSHPGSHQADLQPLLKCMCEGKGNWAVVNLMFLSNQVILCSWSLKGNSCFLAPLLRGHLPLCLLQLLGNRQCSLRKVTAFQHFSKCCGGGRGSTKRALC